MWNRRSRINQNSGVILPLGAHVMGDALTDQPGQLVRRAAVQVDNVDGKSTLAIDVCGETVCVNYGGVLKPPKTDLYSNLGFFCITVCSLSFVTLFFFKK